MNLRKIDFYIKGLPLDTRLEIFKRLDYVGVEKVERLLEKKNDYSRLKRMGFPDKYFERIEMLGRERFKAVNDYVTANGRYPFFTDPNDTYQSSVEYQDLLRRRPEEEIEEFFGCSWEAYVPRKYNAM